MAEITTTDQAVMALEEPLRFLGEKMGRDELENILESCLDDVYEDEDAT